MFCNICYERGYGLRRVNGFFPLGADEWRYAYIGMFNAFTVLLLVIASRTTV